MTEFNLELCYSRAETCKLGGQKRNTMLPSWEGGGDILSGEVIVTHYHVSARLNKGLIWPFLYRDV